MQSLYNEFNNDNLNVINEYVRGVCKDNGIKQAKRNYDWYREHGKKIKGDVREFMRKQTINNTATEYGNRLFNLMEEAKDFIKKEFGSLDATEQAAHAFAYFRNGAKDESAKRPITMKDLDLIKATIGNNTLLNNTMLKFLNNVEEMQRLICKKIDEVIKSIEKWVEDLVYSSSVEVESGVFGSIASGLTQIYTNLQNASNVKTKAYLDAFREQLSVITMISSALDRAGAAI